MWEYKSLEDYYVEYEIYYHYFSKDEVMYVNGFFLMVFADKNFLYVDVKDFINV